MKQASPEVDEYIERAAPFARPILKRIRKAFHKAHPAIRETMKWRFPHFEHEGIVGSMAAFRNHVSWGFWNANLLSDPHRLMSPVGKTTMCSMKVTGAGDLPSEEIMIDYVREAVRLQESGVNRPRKRGAKRPELEMPPAFAAALARAPEAAKTLDRFPPSHRREYIEWIAEARQEATRTSRIQTAIEWLSEGKQRNWKYARKR